MRCSALKLTARSLPGIWSAGTGDFFCSNGVSSYFRSFGCASISSLSRLLFSSRVPSRQTTTIGFVVNEVKLLALPELRASRAGLSAPADLRRMLLAGMQCQACSSEASTSERPDSSQPQASSTGHTRKAQPVVRASAAWPKTTRPSPPQQQLSQPQTRPLWLSDRPHTQNWASPQPNAQRFPVAHQSTPRQQPGHEQRPAVKHYVAQQQARRQLEPEEDFEHIDRQLPEWVQQLEKDKNNFDWSATADHSSKRLVPKDDVWGVERMTGDLEPVVLQKNGVEHTLTPVWVVVHLEEDDNASLYIYPSIIDEGYAEILEKGNLLAGIHKCNLKGLQFNSPDIRHGRWLNYAVGLSGTLSQEETDSLWPNEVWHGERSAYNLRDWYDLAQFLAVPSKDILEAHRDNLRRWAEDKKYHKRWVYHAMCSRWGPDPLLDNGIDFD